MPETGTVSIPYVPGKWWPYRRNKPGGTLETDAVMRQRIQSDVLWSVQIRHISCNGRLGPFFLLPSHMPHIVVTARISRTQYKRIYKETLWCKRTISKSGMCVTLSSWLCALRNGAARPADAARAAVWPRGTSRPVPARLCVHLDGTRGACCILSRRVTQPLAGPRGDSAA